MAMVEREEKEMSAWKELQLMLKTDTSKMTKEELEEFEFELRLKEQEAYEACRD